MPAPAVAIDCEMVGTGHNGRKNRAARVSLVNERGECVFDEYIKPNKKVTDYRTAISGITASHLIHAKPIEEVRIKVAKLIRKNILVGHSVSTDLKSMGLSHPEKKMKDISTLPVFQSGGQPVALKTLAAKHLGLTIQTGSHSSVQDAKITMELYLKCCHKKP